MKHLRVFESSLKFIFQLLVVLYRIVLSPILGGACRFHPSCSCYAEEALQKYSFFEALKLILIRLSSCRPGGRFGYDPVPEKIKDHQYEK